MKDYQKQKLKQRIEQGIAGLHYDKKKDSDQTLEAISNNEDSKTWEQIEKEGCRISIRLDKYLPEIMKGEADPNSYPKGIQESHAH